MKKRVLFICTHNSSRSQMAEGLLNSLHDDRYGAYSAGTEKTVVNPYAIGAMGRIGIDISNHRSKTVEEFKGQNFDFGVTVCDSAGESCPFFPYDNIIYKGFEDPSGVEGSHGQVLVVFEKVRDEIMKWIKKTFNK